MRAYGLGVPHLENIVRDTIIDIVEMVQETEGEPVNIHELCIGYLCCVIASMVTMHSINKLTNCLILGGLDQKVNADG